MLARLASRATVAAVLAALALVLPACGTSAPGAQTPAAELDFTAPTVDGSSLNTGNLSGTPVVLWFWAPWCTICRAEAPDVADVAAEYDGQVTFLGVAGLGEVEAMRGFVAETGTGGFTHLNDVDGALWARFGVAAQPAFVFVDRDGRTELYAGGLSADALRTRVEQLTSV